MPPPPLRSAMIRRNAPCESQRFSLGQAAERRTWFHDVDVHRSRVVQREFHQRRRRRERRQRSVGVPQRGARLVGQKHLGVGVQRALDFALDALRELDRAGADEIADEPREDLLGVVRLSEVAPVERLEPAMPQPQRDDPQNGRSAQEEEGRGPDIKVTSRSSR